MTTTVRLNFAKPPAAASAVARFFGFKDLGNTQKMADGNPDDHSLVINVDPSKHCNWDGTLKRLDELITDPALSQEERDAFALLKSADKVELLGHGAPGSKTINSNPCQNNIFRKGTSFLGETEYNVEDIGRFLADCDKGPDVNVISCNSASTVDGESICTRLRGALNKQAKLNDKPTGAITGYTKSCGVDENGEVFLSVTPHEERQFSWLASIPFIGPLLAFLADLIFGGGPDRGTKDYNDLKNKSAEGKHVIIDNECVIADEPAPRTTQDLERELPVEQNKQRISKVNEHVVAAKKSSNISMASEPLMIAPSDSMLRIGVSSLPEEMFQVPSLNTSSPDGASTLVNDEALGNTAPDL